MMDENYSILRFYVSTTDKAGLITLYEHIVKEAHKQGISGATVYKGTMGYGLSSNKIVTAEFWEISEKLPIIVEFVDKTEVLNVFYQGIEHELKDSGKGCLVYMLPINLLLQQCGNKK